MGGGNGQKAATARIRKQEKDAKAKKQGSQLKQNQAALSYKCSICLQTFICTTTEAKFKEHHENRHPKNTLVECFAHLQ